MKLIFILINFFKTLGTVNRVRVNEYLSHPFFKLQQPSASKFHLEMKTALFLVFIAFILACGLVFCEEYKTEFEDEGKTELEDVDKTEFEDEGKHELENKDKTEFEDEDKTEFEDEDKTESDDESAEVDDPRRLRRLRCKSSKYQY